MSKDTESDIMLNTPRPAVTSSPEYTPSESDNIPVPVALLRRDITALLSLNELVFLIHLLAFLDNRSPVFSSSPASLSVSLGLSPAFIRQSIAGLEAGGWRPYCQDTPFGAQSA